MINAVRLLLLLVLSLQTAAFSWAIPGGISALPIHPLHSSLKACADPLSTSKSATIDYMAHEAKPMAMPCDVAENEKWDTASDEGLQEALHFNLALGKGKTLLPRSERWYNFFIRYGIPPPEGI